MLSNLKSCQNGCNYHQVSKRSMLEASMVGLFGNQLKKIRFRAINFPKMIRYDQPRVPELCKSRPLQGRQWSVRRPGTAEGGAVELLVLLVLSAPHPFIDAIMGPYLSSIYSWYVHLVDGLVAINFIFPEILGMSHHPNWRIHIFQRGGPTTNQSCIFHNRPMICLGCAHDYGKPHLLPDGARL